MSETIVGVTKNFKINLEVLSAHVMQFLFFGAKNCQKQPKTAKVSRKLSVPQQKQPKSLRAAAGRIECGESP